MGAKMSAGNYPDRFEWFSVTRPAPDLVGHRAAARDWPGVSQGFLWGVLEDLQPGEETLQGSDKPTVRARVRLRNMPPVKVQDRLRHTEYNETYRIESVTRGDNELILDVIR